MSRPGFEAVLIGYALGSLLAITGLGTETWLLGSQFSLDAAAGYGLAGGSIAAGASFLFSFCLPALAGRTAAVFTLGIFVALELIYFINVRVFPGDHYLSPKGLIADAAVVAVALLPAIRISRSTNAQVVRTRFSHLGAGVGGALAVTAMAVLAWRWPDPAKLPDRTGDGPDLLIVVLDSVRWDHLGIGGYSRPTSPSLDALAATARVFENAYAASTWTVPSVAVILGASPAERLPENLATSGYVTACFTDNPHLAPGSSLVTGFDLVQRGSPAWRWVFRRTVVGEALERVMPSSDRRLVDRAVEWIRTVRGPLFGYVHLMDSHTPYRHPGIDGKRRPERRIQFPYAGMNITALEAEDIVSRYDGGVRSADSQAARLIRAIRERRRPFLAVITADHGESLGESGRWFHGGSLAPELLAVPLLAVGEGVKPGRVEDPVGHAAIPGTLLAAAGVLRGASGGDDLRAGQPRGFAEGGLPPDHSFRVAGRYKLTLNAADGTRRLFDRLTDPHELNDIAGEKRLLSERLAAVLNARHTHHSPNYVAAQVEALRALGYVR